MTFPVFPTNVQPPDWGMAVARKPRTLRSNFGDGYSQRSADGINTIITAVTPKWTNLSAADRATIDSFLVEMGGITAFLFTTPDDGVTRLYTCSQWASAPKAAGFYDMSASFSQEFDLGYSG